MKHTHTSTHSTISNSILPFPLSLTAVPNCDCRLVEALWWIGLQNELRVVGRFTGRAPSNRTWINPKFVSVMASWRLSGREDVIGSTPDSFYQSKPPRPSLPQLTTLRGKMMQPGAHHVCSLQCRADNARHMCVCVCWRGYSALGHSHLHLIWKTCLHYIQRSK